MNNDLETRVKEVLDMFRPNLQADGGDMEFISIEVVQDNASEEQF